MSAPDRVGLGWRAPLAGPIVGALGRIDVLEVVAEDWFDATGRERRALRSLAAQRPLWVHGVSLGLASTVAVDRRRLERFARLVGDVEPEGWSEHMAFVRGGGVEIGHLAAPPRDSSTVEGCAANVERARLLIGSSPALENVATLIDPPGSDRDEPLWVSQVVAASGADFLLDLHNLHSNARNFGFDAHRALESLPLDRCRVVHIAGGRPSGRWVDDHLHPVPDPVYALLTDVARRTDRSLTVLLERDGAYPPFAELLAELDRARAAIALGRRDRVLAGV